VFELRLKRVQVEKVEVVGGNVGKGSFDWSTAGKKGRTAPGSALGKGTGTEAVPVPVEESVNTRGIFRPLCGELKKLRAIQRKSRTPGKNPPPTGKRTLEL